MKRASSFQATVENNFPTAPQGRAAGTGAGAGEGLVWTAVSANLESSSQAAQDEVSP